jgi:hypothetical protein
MTDVITVDYDAKTSAAATVPAVTGFDYDTLPVETADALRKQASRIRERAKATTAAVIDIGRDLAAVKHQLSGLAGLRVESHTPASRSRVSSTSRRYVRHLKNKGLSS